MSPQWEENLSSIGCFIWGLPFCCQHVTLLCFNVTTIINLLFFPPTRQCDLNNREEVMRGAGWQFEVLNLCFRHVRCAVTSSAGYIFFMSHAWTVWCSRVIFSFQNVWPACLRTAGRHSGRAYNFKKSPRCVVGSNQGASCRKRWREPQDTVQPRDNTASNRDGPVICWADWIFAPLITYCVKSHWGRSCRRVKK